MASRSESGLGLGGKLGSGSGPGLGSPGSTEAFSPARGGRADATRLLIVVTDGESHDGEELPEALAECDERNVTRYAIAVSARRRASPARFPRVCPRRDALSPAPCPQVLGHYLRRQQDPEDFIREIKFIASDPDEKYFFNVTDEAALNDIVDALGDRIFSLEGDAGPGAGGGCRTNSWNHIWRNNVTSQAPPGTTRAPSSWRCPRSASPSTSWR